MNDRTINKQLINTLSRLDSTTYNHSVRVMKIAAEVEEYMGFTDHRLMSAALFHDIGKLYVPFNILDKSGRLTNLERELIDLHPYIGYTILSDLGVREDVCRIVLYHHGFRPLTIHNIGYYDKDNIYEQSVILRTIDHFEALTSDRPYHRGVTSQDALDTLVREGDYNDSVLNYITETSSGRCMKKNSAVHRTNRPQEEQKTINELIMNMDL